MSDSTITNPAFEGGMFIDDNVFVFRSGELDENNLQPTLFHGNVRASHCVISILSGNNYGNSCTFESVTGQNFGSDCTSAAIIGTNRGDHCKIDYLLGDNYGNHCVIKNLIGKNFGLSCTITKHIENINTDGTIITDYHKLPRTPALEDKVVNHEVKQEHGPGYIDLSSEDEEDVKMMILVIFFSFFFVSFSFSFFDHLFFYSFLRRTLNTKKIPLWHPLISQRRLSLSLLSLWVCQSSRLTKKRKRKKNPSTGSLTPSK